MDLRTSSNSDGAITKEATAQGCQKAVDLGNSMSIYSRESNVQEVFQRSRTAQVPSLDAGMLGYLKMSGFACP